MFARCFPSTQLLAKVEKQSLTDLFCVTVPSAWWWNDSEWLGTAHGDNGDPFPHHSGGRGAGLLLVMEITAQQRLPEKRNRFLPGKGCRGRGRTGGGLFSCHKVSTSSLFMLLVPVKGKLLLFSFRFALSLFAKPRV